MVGGYAIQLGRSEGLRVIADGSAADEDLVRRLGADVVVPRGPDVAARMRQVVPDGVDALLDAAVMGAPVLAAVRDGGQVIAVRSFAGPAERGIGVSLVLVFGHLHVAGRLARLAGQAAAGVAHAAGGRRAARRTGGRRAPPVRGARGARQAGADVLRRF
jgi:NADPH2:quinone reductase